MIKNFLRPLIVCLLISPTALFSQDTITLMSGKIIDCSIQTTDQTELQFLVSNKKGKTKLDGIHKSDIFSYKMASMPETILYAKDEILGDNLSVPQMRTFIAGEQDAYNNYKTTIPFWGGFALAGGISYLGEGNVFLSLGPPVLWAIGQVLPPLKIKEKYISNLTYQYNDIYAQGFEKVARGRKVRKALLGAVLGSATGLLISQIK